MNLSTITRRLEALEAKRIGGQRIHVVTARDGDTATVDRLMRQHIEAGQARDDDLFVVIRKFSEWNDEPSIHTCAARPA